MRVGVWVVVSSLAAGCAARGSGPVEVAQPNAAPVFTSAIEPRTGTSLAEFIAKGRELAAAARPPDRTPVPFAESRDPKLAAALATALHAPSPETLRAVAAEYRRLGIVDRAHQYLQEALQLNGRDAATYDAVARLWRDSGLPALALPEAYRAVYYAPSSAAARNTLGTVFQALGRRPEARAQYEHALELDPAASYALNNLCYAWLLDGAPQKAVASCQAALRQQPQLAAARNNLALAYAALGNVGAARATFDAAGDRASAAYNLGIVHMAQRRYTDAVSAFAAAQQARPSSRTAAARAAQAGKLARAGVGE